MSSPPRPRQATFAAGLIIGGSVLLVLSAFDQVSGLRTLESQEAVQDFLSEPPGDGLGLQVDDVLTILRILAMVAAAIAAAMAVLGIQVLQRSRSSRLILSVLTVPLMVTGIAAGGVIAPVVTVAVVMLWLQPSRDWFDGITPSPPPPPVRAREAAAPPSYPSAPEVPTTSEPRAYQGFGTAPAPYAPPPAAPGAPAVPPARPAGVLWACVLTWATSGLIAFVMLFSALVIAVSPELVLDELRRQDQALPDDMSEDMFIGASIVAAVVLVIWCAAAIVLAWFAFRRATWAQVTLLVSAGIAGALCLFGAALGSFVLMVPLAACSATFALLMRPEVRRWYAARGTI